MYQRLLDSGVRDSEMEHLLQQIIKEPIIAYEFLVTRRVKANEIDGLLKIKNKKQRRNSKEVKLELDGVSSLDPAFHNVLVNNGECIRLR